MSPHVSKKEINDVVWRACDTFRGAVDPSEYKKGAIHFIAPRNGYFIEFIPFIAKTID